MEYPNGTKELQVILTPEIESFISNTFNKDISANGDTVCYGRFRYTRKASDPEHQYMASHIDDNLLPSQFQNGDQVSLNFHDAGKVVNCEVIKVHFTDRKVLYDVEVMMNGDDAEVTTRLYNIDSCFVEPAD